LCDLPRWAGDYSPTLFCLEFYSYFQCATKEFNFNSDFSRLFHISYPPFSLIREPFLLWFMCTIWGERSQQISLIYLHFLQKNVLFPLCSSQNLTIVQRLPPPLLLLLGMTQFASSHGMDRHTGKPLSGLDHLRQSLIDILTTRVGLRVMLRDYGGLLPSLIDNPTNQFFAVDLYVAIAGAINQWEPRLKLEQIFYKNLGDGRIEVDLRAIYLPKGTPLKMQGLVVS